MAVKTPSPKPITDTAKQQPPDERFWVKYSRHHELPISSMASLAWQVFLGMLIVVVALVIAGNRDGGMPIETISIGGGGPGGAGNDSSAPGGLREAADGQETPKDVRPLETPADVPAVQIQPADLLKNMPIDPEGQREVAKPDDLGNQATDKLANANRRINAMLGSGGAGRRGPCSGGRAGGGV